MTYKKRLSLFIQLLTCCLLLTAIGINKNKKVFGVTLENSVQPVNQWVTDDGYIVISTQHIAKDIWGYGGNIPLHIYLKNNSIERVEVQSNSENPKYLSNVINKGLLNEWNGLSFEEAYSKNVDAISGATLTSNAIIESVRRAKLYVRDDVSYSNSFNWFDIRFWCVLIIVLTGVIIPLFYKNKLFRTLQLILNVIVLGFWSGSFISLSLLVNYLSNGMNLWMSIIPLLLLIAAFVLPFFGKNNHYCMWLCPLGSCQEIIGKIVPQKYKMKISPKINQYLNGFREGLWLLIMAIMWLGIGFELMDYELFSVFMFQQMGLPFIIVAFLFALLSGVLTRPYCRFVCPTGSIIKFSQSK